jgi:KaiC/GvpD/RAD55 family RecA-like ATPase
MKKRIQIIPSGISLIDKSWGGFYSGGTYLLIGPKKSGKTMLGLQYAMECAKQNEICLFFTSMRPKDLMILAASINFDLQDYMNQNLIIVIRVAPPRDVFKSSMNDEFYVEYLKDIVTVVEKYKPAKIVFDELTPFISFNNINLLKQTFLKTIETIEESGIISLFILGEPATPAAKKIVESLSDFSTGIVRLQKDEFNDHGGIISITPNIGHNEGRFNANYYIEPYKGIIDDFKQVEKISPAGKTDNYRSLFEIELPEEDIFYHNLYSINDFELILNNQIALYKSTGQSFSLISFRLEPAAAGLMSANQLYNAIRLSIDRKDKLCRLDNLQVILLLGDDQKSINSILSRVKKNLPGDEENAADYLKAVSVFVLKIDPSVSGAEDLLRKVQSGENQEKSKFGYY